MRVWAGLLTLLVLVGIARGQEDIDYNRQIRPLLSKRCWACHGRDQGSREGGLRLDQRDSALAEADSGGVAIVPGHPESSELIARVTSQDESMRMPPPETGPAFSSAEVELLKGWIAEGAPFARHWSFEVPQRPDVPKVGDSTWPRNPIDHFILSSLEHQGLAPNPPADRVAMIRRLSFDLRGLPPSLPEVVAYQQDEAPDAYEHLVDRLLDAPAFGERFARPWLDLARYADSSGYGSDPLRGNMWRYRDWVIDALNQNMPFDQFTIQQLAGDMLPDATLEQQMATAFHRNTMTNTEGGTDDEEFRVAAVQDRVDTTIQVWMGLTMGCAKCHDHKYDPISQRDYYSMFAIFNQTRDADRPDEAPTIEAPRPEDLAALEAHDARLAEREQQLDELNRQVAGQPAAPLSDAQGRYVRIELPGKSRILSLAEVEVFRGSANVATAGQASQASVDFEGPARLAIDGNRSGDYAMDKSTTHTRQQADPWWEVDLGEAMQIDRIVIWNRTDNNLQGRLVPLRAKLLDDTRAVVWEATVDQAPRPSHELVPRELTPLERQQAAVEREIAALRKSRPKVPTLPVLQQLPPDQRRETHVLVRGEFLNRGELVQPAILTSFHNLSDGAEPNRLGLAHWLVDARNPLTARVAVNRLWGLVFGTGLVSTPEDFGTQGEEPSHPELLDWLATRFVESGWNVKELLRLMVTSATYRQSAVVREDHLARDPQNRWLARGVRVRLEAEMIRDQALALSGLLSRRIGGPSVYPYQPPGLWRAAFNGQRTWPTSQGEQRYRRGLYTFWRRTVPYPSMATFDAPSRELCTVRRLRTNTPLQAFVCLNDPVYVEAAQGLARRLIREGGDSSADRAAYGLRLCLGRAPTAAQIQPLERLFAAELRHYRQDVAAARQLATEPWGAVEVESELPELAAWTVVANVLLNMDGVLNK